MLRKKERLTGPHAMLIDMGKAAHCERGKTRPEQDDAHIVGRSRSSVVYDL